MKSVVLSIIRMPLIILPSSSLLLIVQLIRHKDNRKSNAVFCILLVLISTEVLLIFIRELLGGKFFYQVIWPPLYFLWGPLLYFYFRFILNLKDKFYSHDAMYALPGVSFLLLSLYTYNVDRSFFIMNPYILTVFLMIQMFVYLVFVIIDIAKFLKKLQISITRSLSVWAVQLYCFWFVSYMFVVLDAVTDYNFYLFFLVNLCLLILFIQYKNYKSLHDFTPDHPGEKKRKYGNIRLSPDLVRQYVLEIESAMKEEMLFAEQNMSIAKFSRYLHLPAHHVSQAINSNFGMSFFNYINSCRLEYAKKMLLNPSHKNKTVLQIAYESGFNSKSTFNMFFRKTTGITPSEFRNKNSKFC